MGYPVQGINGVVNSWSGTFQSNLLSKMVANAAVHNMSAAAAQVTGLNAAVESYIPGVGTWEVTIGGTAFASSRLGNQGLVAFSAGGYVYHVDSARVKIEAQVHDITAFAATSPIWGRFMPGVSNWSATYRCRVDSANNVPIPHLAPTTSDGGASLPTVTFTYGKSNDATLAGSCMIDRVSPAIRRGDQVWVDIGVRGTGALTPAGAGSILGSTAFGQPEWDQGSSPPVSTTQPSISFQAATSRTYVGSCFWKSIELAWDVRSPVSIVVVAQGTGELVPS